MSIVSFVVIGYHFNHLDGKLNCQAFTHCIINRTAKLLTVQLVIVAWHNIYVLKFVLFIICFQYCLEYFESICIAVYICSLIF